MKFRVGIKATFLTLTLLCLPSFAQDRPEGIPSQAVAFNNHWYLPIYDAKGPETAAEACLESGGYLALVNSEEEHDFLKSLLTDHAQSRFWLGGNKVPGEDWKWTADQPMRPGELALISTSSSPLFVAIRTVENQRDLAGIPAESKNLPVSGFICEWGDSQTFSAPKGASVTLGGSGDPIAIPDEERSILCVLGEEESGAPIIAQIVAKGVASSESSGLSIDVDGSYQDESLENAANEVATLLRLRHGGKLHGRVEISSQGDAEESALDAGTALAWAVLIESLITGFEIDSESILMGDINADGKTRPAGSVPVRLSYLGSNSYRVGIPNGDRHTLSDLLLVGTPAPLCGNSITILSNFSEAVEFAKTNAASTEDVRTARAEQLAIRNLYATRKDDFLSLLKHPSVQTKLTAILDTIPNAGSASTLRAMGKGQLTKTLSLSGSSHFIHSFADDIFTSANRYDKDPNKPVQGGDAVADNVSAIRKIRNQLDPKTHPLADAIIRLGTALKKEAAQPSTSTSGRQKFYDEVQPMITTVRKESALFDTELLENR